MSLRTVDLLADPYRVPSPLSVSYISEGIPAPEKCLKILQRILLEIKSYGPANKAAAIEVFESASQLIRACSQDPSAKPIILDFQEVERRMIFNLVSHLGCSIEEIKHLIVLNTLDPLSYQGCGNLSASSYYLEAAKHALEVISKCSTADRENAIRAFKIVSELFTSCKKNPGAHHLLEEFQLLEREMLKHLFKIGVNFSEVKLMIVLNDPNVIQAASDLLDFQRRGVLFV